MRRIQIFATIAVVCVGTVYGFPSGAPSFICGTMVPGHGQTTTSGEPPYKINVTAKQGNSGEVVLQGTLYSTTGSTFKGFLIETVQTDSSSGLMSGDKHITQNVCGPQNNSGLTHIDSSNKTHVDFTWTSLNSSIPDIQFKATVVEKFSPSRYWLNITSEKLSPTTDKPTSASVTPPMAPSSTVSPGQIVFDPDCGISKGCFSDCGTSGCTYLITWQKNDNESTAADAVLADSSGTVLFDLKVKLKSTENKWVAVGISPTGKMDQTNVAACLSQTTGVSIQSSYNNGYSNSPFTNPSLGLSLIEGDVKDGVFHCKFTRDIYLTNMTAGFLDLNQTYYVLVGNGDLQYGILQKHSTDPVSSSDKVDFLKDTVLPASTTGTPASSNPTTNPSTGVPTTQTPSGQIVYDQDCGVSKGCFPDCSQKVCDYLVTWYKNQSKNGVSADQDIGNIIFDIKMKMSDTFNKWIAVGISPQGTMSGTNVAACLSQQTGITLQSSHNGPYSNTLFKDSLLGLKLLQGDVSDGIIHCKFSRVERDNTEPEFLDLNNTYYLVVGTGPVSGGVISQHTTDPFKSQSKVNFLKNYVSKQDNSGPSMLIKLHASLMVIAWVFLSSVGVVAARHCKTILAEKLYFKVKAWFLIHRGVMFLAVVCVIIAFVVIFVEVKGFSKIATEAGKEFVKAHPYTGIVTTALALMNPILAIFRPAPTAKNRPFFNWIHFIVGNTAHLIAVITIFFGIELQSAKIHKSALYVMTSYCVVYIIIHLILEIYRRNNDQKTDKEQFIDSRPKYETLDVDYDRSFRLEESVKDKNMEAYGSLHRSNSTSGLISGTEEKTNNFPFYMLLLHCILMLILAVFLVLIICLPQRMKDLFDQ